jgi:hypothetical protein
MDRLYELRVNKSAGGFLVLASAAFWISWMLMPGVGVTDTATIFARVGTNRPSVLASVILQLVSAASYAPGLVGIAMSDGARRTWTLRVGCVLLAIGAMGSAADAIFHLVAYEMTGPGLASEAMIPVMQRLQGPDLALLLPFVMAFFVGNALLVVAHRKRGPIARAGSLALIASPATLVAGVPMVRLGILAGRVVGLAFLAATAGSLALIGLSITAEPREHID